MMIVLEGCDGSGKTTLARQLAKVYDIPIHHEGPPPANLDAVEHYERVIRMYANLIENGAIKGVVFDRLAFGERIYGPVYRGFDRLGVDGWADISRALDSHSAHQVFCKPEYTVCRDNWRARRTEEMLVSEDQLRAVYDSYEFMAGDEKFFVYNYTCEPFETIIAWLDDAEFR